MTRKLCSSKIFVKRFIVEHFAHSKMFFFLQNYPTFSFSLFFFDFHQKFSNFLSNLFEKWFENGQRHHFSIKLFKSYFVDDIVLYKTMFIHVSSIGKNSHFYRFSKKKIQFVLSPSNFFSIFKNQTNNFKFLFCTQKIFNLLYKIETN